METDPSPAVIGDFIVAHDHPCLAGHFPGRPIVPGVMLLDEVFSCLRRQEATGPIKLDSVKFTAPVLPGETVRIIVQPGARGSVRFACEVDGVRVMAGAVTFPATA